VVDFRGHCHPPFDGNCVQLQAGSAIKITAESAQKKSILQASSGSAGVALFAIRFRLPHPAL
jgi:hypothetical protein